MTKVTIVKNYRNNVTLRQIDLSEAVQMIQEQAYEALCEQLRHVYPLVEVRQKYDAMDGLFNLYTKDIPKVLPVRFPIPCWPSWVPADGV